MPASDFNVSTQHNDSARTGAYLQETALTPGTVGGPHFQRLYERNVNGDQLAQILYVRNVPNTRLGTKNLFFAATSTNEVYAFDADDHSATGGLVWKTAPLGPTRLLNDREMCRETIGTLGITSTPVIDITAQTMYVVARHWERGGAPTPPGSADLAGDNYLHALKLSDGTPRVPPRKVEGTDPRTSMTFDPTVQRNRPGLLLLNGRVYVAFATLSCDAGKYHGWVFGYAADTLTPTAIFCTTRTTSNQWGAGIWQSGNGLVGTNDGHIYFETGNDVFVPQNDAEKASPPRAAELADAFVKLHVIPQWPGLELAGSFQPSNSKRLRDGDRDNKFQPIGNPPHWGDTDLGSGGPVMLPGNRLVGGGKQGRFYVLDPATMHLTQDQAAADPTRIGEGFQAFKNTFHPEYTESDYGAAQDFGPNIHGGPVYWSGPSYLYQMPEKDYLKAYHYDPQTGVLHHENGPIATASIRPERDGMPGGHSSLSANGSRDGIVWTIRPIQDATANPRAMGQLHAFDALTLKEIWNDRELERFAKFNPPTIADGKVFRPVWAQYSLMDTTVFDHTTQQIAAVSRASGNLDLFVIGFNNAVWSTFWNTDVGWNPGGWFQIHPETVFDHTTQQIAAVSRASGNLDLFVIGFNNAVWSTFWNTDVGWNPGGWFQIQAQGGHHPAPTPLSPGKVVVYGLVDQSRMAPLRQEQSIRLGGGWDPARRWTIGELRARLGGAGVLAMPLGGEIEVGDKRGGRRQDFTGAVSSARQHVSSRAVAALGRPTFDHPPSKRKAVQVRASIFWSEHTGAHLVLGEILDEYLRQGGPTGPLGYPVESETNSQDHRGRVSRFENGAIVWDAQTGAKTHVHN